jgi:hypothetical protein
MNYKGGFYFKLSLLLSCCLFLVAPFASSMANRPAMKSAFSFLGASFKTSAQDAQDAQGKPKEVERKIMLGGDPPPAIEILRMSGYKSPNWLDDFELEIKNKSDRPIYYMLFLLETPEMNRGESLRELRALEFGEPELYGSNVQPKDLEKSPHLDPGESTTLKIPKNSKEAYKHSLGRALQEGIVQTDQVTKFILHINLVKFADGTGYHGNN